MNPTLGTLRGHVLEIGSSRRHASYAKGVHVDIYEPSKRIRNEIEPDVDAKLTITEQIPDRKYDAIVVSYVYEILKENKAQELSAIIGARLRIDGLCIVFERIRPKLIEFLLRRWTGTTIEDTEHGLKAVDSYTEKGVRVRVYRRVVR